MYFIVLQLNRCICFVINQLIKKLTTTILNEKDFDFNTKFVFRFDLKSKC